MIETLLAPLQFGFMVRGLLAAVVVGIVCSIVGTYVVLRGMAFFGSALAHSVLPGLAAGYLVTGATRGVLFWWGLATAILVSLGIGAVSRAARLKEDTAIGILFAAMFALGIALISSARSYAVDLTHFLFGNVLGVSTADLWQIGLFGAIVVLVILALYKEFLVLAFDPMLAQTMRLPTKALDYLLLVLIAVTIVVSLQTVGVALMVAMLVTPAATGTLLAKRLPGVMLTAAIVGAVSGVIGLYVSYFVGIASGPAIVLVCTAIFLLTLMLAPGRGKVWQWLLAPE
ncbi:MAG: metal ABC transporter permease [Candidatus Bipolaricaulia bacterium]